MCRADTSVRDIERALGLPPGRAHETGPFTLRFTAAAVAALWPAVWAAVEPPRAAARRRLTWRCSCRVRG